MLALGAREACGVGRATGPHPDVVVVREAAAVEARESSGAAREGSRSASLRFPALDCSLSYNSFLPRSLLSKMRDFIRWHTCTGSRGCQTVQAKV